MASVSTTTTSTTLPPCDPNDCDANVCTVGDACVEGVCQPGNRLTAAQLSGFVLDNTSVTELSAPATSGSRSRRLSSP
jgi:hypothetical protein